MDFLETITVMSITTFLAVHSALGARYDVTEIPWICLIIKPKYFGGRSTLMRNLMWLLIWVSISNIFMLLCAVLINASEPAIGKIYTIIQYDSEPGDEVNIVTLIVITAAMYLMLVKQTIRIVEEECSYIPTNLINTEDEEEIKHQTQILKSTKGKFSGFLRNIYYVAPKILASVYSHFWRSASLIKHGCVRLIYDKYGKDIILDFYKEHAAQTPDRELIEKIDNVVNNASSKRNKAFAILSIKISFKGYYNTDGLLNNYLITKSKSYETEKRKTKSKRKFPSKPLNIAIVSDGNKKKHKILEYSKDGSSLYIASKWPSDLNKEIQILFEDTLINCEVIHKNARTYGGQLQLGLALKIVDQIGKDIFLKSVAEKSLGQPA